MTSRGVRLNNPGNIRLGLLWQGMADVQPDPDFIAFATPEYGIRAMAKVLITYAKRYRINTIKNMITRYAPPSENNTAAYIKDVSDDAGYSAGEEIDLTDAAVLNRILPAIIKHEEGMQPYSQAQLTAGIQMAVS